MKLVLLCYMIIEGKILSFYDKFQASLFTAIVNFAYQSFIKKLKIR